MRLRRLFGRVNDQDKMSLDQIDRIGGAMWRNMGFCEAYIPLGQPRWTVALYRLIPEEERWNERALARNLSLHDALHKLENVSRTLQRAAQKYGGDFIGPHPIDDETYPHYTRVWKMVRATYGQNSGGLTVCRHPIAPIRAGGLSLCRETHYDKRLMRMEEQRRQPLDKDPALLAKCYMTNIL